MTSFSVTSFKKAISNFQEDFVQIPTQKKSDPCFRSDDPVMRPNAHQCQEASEQLQFASVRTSWQDVRTLFRVREDFSFPLQTRIGKTVCICLDDRATPSRHGPYYGNYMQTICSHSDSRETSSGRDLNKESVKHGMERWLQISIRMASA
jgi:hypothetical protein